MDKDRLVPKPQKARGFIGRSLRLTCPFIFRREMGYQNLSFGFAREENQAWGIESESCVYRVAGLDFGGTTFETADHRLRAFIVECNPTNHNYGSIAELTLSLHPKCATLDAFAPAGAASTNT